MTKTWAISSLESDGLSEDMHKTFNAQTPLRKPTVWQALNIRRLN
jgi:hypothetical protein